jgi:hypothetical protein
MAWIHALIVAVAVFGLALWTTMADRSENWELAGHQPESSLTNLHLYDRDGRPLTGVQVFDQWGNPVVLPGQPGPWHRPGSGEPAQNVYPRPAGPGFGGEEPLQVVPPLSSGEPVEPGPPGSERGTGEPVPDPSASVSPSPSVSPLPTPSPTPAPSGSATPPAG